VEPRCAARVPAPHRGAAGLAIGSAATSRAGAPQGRTAVRETERRQELVHSPPQRGSPKTPKAQTGWLGLLVVVGHSGLEPEANGLRRVLAATRNTDNLRRFWWFLIDHLEDMEGQEGTREDSLDEPCTVPHLFLDPPTWRWILHSPRLGPTAARTVSPARTARRARRQRNAIRRRHRAHHRVVARGATRDAGTPLDDVRPARRDPAACGPAPHAASVRHGPRRGRLTQIVIPCRRPSHSEAPQRSGQSSSPTCATTHLLAVFRSPQSKTRLQRLGCSC